MNLTPNQERLLRYAQNYAKDGNWTHLGEDARPDALVLAELGLVEVNEDQTQYRLDNDGTPPPANWPDVAVVTRDDTKDVVAVLILNGGYDSIKAHRTLKAKYGIPDNVHLHSRMIGTEPVPEPQEA